MTGYTRCFEIDDSHCLHLYEGSLAEVHADALVSSDDNYLTAGGGVSQALARAAGPDAAFERIDAAFMRRARLGEVVRTSAGMLPCHHLYHAITIDIDRQSTMDEAALRQLIANLLEQATQDGVTSLGMPALGTGAAGFSLESAARIMMHELLTQLPKTPVRRVVLALMGNRAERLFYENLVRSQAGLVALATLRDYENGKEEQDIKAEFLADDDCEMERPRLLDVYHDTVERPESPVSIYPQCAMDWQDEDHPEPSINKSGEVIPLEGGFAEEPPIGSLGEVVEQLPSLVDEQRLASLPAGRPRLVAGLAELILAQAAPDDVEDILLSQPCCHGFKGSTQQRLMEFLYLSEDHQRGALDGLFNPRELRKMAVELGEEAAELKEKALLINLILRALGFNPLEAPVGISKYIGDLGKLIENADNAQKDKVAIETGKILEQLLDDLLQMYGTLFWGSEYKSEFVRRKFVEKKQGGLTIGKAREVLRRLDACSVAEPDLQKALREAGRERLFPKKLALEYAKGTVRNLDCEQIIQAVIDIRNQASHYHAADQVTAVHELLAAMRELRDLLLAYQQNGIYPHVLRYEGVYENRHGERFVYFVDEKNKRREVRTDEKIDPRRHYYCFATNNPMHLFPRLVPKN